MWGAHLTVWPVLGYTTEAVMHGSCETRPTLQLITKLTGSKPNSLCTFVPLIQGKPTYPSESDDLIMLISILSLFILTSKVK